MAKVIVIIVAGLLFAWYASSVFEETFGQADTQTVCTMDAKICPDGSAVGRSGPACEFAQCPAMSDTEPLEEIPPYVETGIDTNLQPLTPTSDEDPQSDEEVPSEPYTPPAINEEDMVMCTMDAMQCPDGSYVGRTGPNCQFVCP